MKDYYGTLCLAGTVDEEAIRAAYYRQSFFVHPDKGGESASTEGFNEVKEASTILYNKVLRERYHDDRNRHTRQQIYGTSVESKIAKA